MILRVLGVFIFIVAAILVVVYIKPIREFSEAYNLRGASIPELESAMEAHPGNVRLAMKLADAYLIQHTGPYDAKADRIYEEVLQREPDNMDAMLGAGRALADEPGKLNEALAIYRKALKVNPGNENILLDLGNIYKAQAEVPSLTDADLRHWLYRWAVYYYRLTLLVDPQNFQARFNLGVAYQQLDEKESAAREYCNAIVLAPDSYESRYNLGLVLLDLNHLNEADRQFRQAVDLLSNSPDQSKQLKTQDLAQTIENVKSSVYYDEDKSGLTPDLPTPFMSSACLLTPPQQKAS